MALIYFETQYLRNHATYAWKTVTREWKPTTSVLVQWLDVPQITFKVVTFCQAHGDATTALVSVSLCYHNVIQLWLISSAPNTASICFSPSVRGPTHVSCQPVLENQSWMKPVLPWLLSVLHDRSVLWHCCIDDTWRASQLQKTYLHHVIPPKKYSRREHQCGIKPVHVEPENSQ